MKVTDEYVFLFRNMTIKTNTKNVKERPGINRVVQRDVTNVKRSGEWLNMDYSRSSRLHVRMSKKSN